MSCSARFGQFSTKWIPAARRRGCLPNVYEAMHRGLKAEQFNFSQKRLGIDVARFGDDATSIVKRQGLNARYPIVQLRGERSTSIAGRVAKEKRDFGSEMEFIDDTGGWASGVIDNCLLGGFPSSRSTSRARPTIRGTSTSGASFTSWRLNG